MMNCIYIIILMIILFYFINIYEDFESCKIIKCDTGYKVDDKTNTCIIDIVCSAGNYNKNGVCTLCSPVLNVYDTKSYDSNCIVTKCKDSYIIDKNNNKCIIVCPSGQKNINNICLTCETILNVNDSSICKTICDFDLNSCKQSICSNPNEVNINNICTSYKTEYKFTNCSAKGRLGPTLDQCKTSYLGTNLQGKIIMNTDRQGIQIWTVPANGKYLITVAGAGYDLTKNETIKLYDVNYDTYYKGAVISSLFTLNNGDVLKILVGQKNIFPFFKNQ